MGWSGLAVAIGAHETAVEYNIFLVNYFLELRQLLKSQCDRIQHQEPSKSVGVALEAFTSINYGLFPALSGARSNLNQV